MAIKKTLGGDRLHSGQKMKVSLKAYERSTHNLSRDWKSTMSCGVLVPFFCELGLKGDTFDIDINALVKTQPTIAPLFGQFKLQLDMFRCPLRLYQGLLHNNPLNIAQNANKILFPKIKLHKGVTEESLGGRTNASSLNRYLGLNGICAPSTLELSRKFFGVPHLAYYDIFKNYYSNKQEENAYVISNQPSEVKQVITEIAFNSPTDYISWEEFQAKSYTLTGFSFYFQINKTTAENTSLDHIYANCSYTTTTQNWKALSDPTISTYYEISYNSNYIIVKSKGALANQTIDGVNIIKYDETYQVEPTGELGLTAFPLTNFDEMRWKILQDTGYNKELVIDKDSLLPYSVNSEYDSYKNTMTGLMLKTYMSDLFNNWLSSETFDALNGIAAVTAVDVSSGKLELDALNIQQKVYNMMNLVAASGGTYQDWEEAVYGEESKIKGEIPTYEGGASYEIGFEEIVSTAETETTAGGNQPLGTLAGKGNVFAKEGGKVVIKCDEACIIMGIASITPRINYSQGNKWFMSEIDTLDDLHKPELDGIGFQDLIQEQMCYSTTQWNANEQKFIKQSAGKQPAWINYMTAISEVFGDFAEEDKAQFMVLDRRYETDEDGNITDLTTYIDPSKYGYAFAESTIESQYFWVQVAMNVEARRKMSAAQIPLM